jgi:hypothetical protein
MDMGVSYGPLQSAAMCAANVVTKVFGRSARQLDIVTAVIAVRGEASRSEV